MNGLRQMHLEISSELKLPCIDDIFKSVGVRVIDQSLGRSKFKRIKLAAENKNLLSDLLNWEKKCVGYSRGLLGAIEVNNKLDVYFDDLKEKKEITDLYYKSYYYKNIIGKISQDNLVSEFQEAVIIPFENQYY